MQYIGHLHGKTQREEFKLIRVYSIFLRIVKIALSNENKISNKRILCRPSTFFDKK